MYTSLTQESIHVKRIPSQAVLKSPLKDDNLKINKQKDRIVHNGHPERWGVRDHPKVEKLGGICPMWDIHIYIQYIVISVEPVP